MVTIAIVGAGFSGTLTAVHLLRRGFGGDDGGRVVILNRSGTLARGVAYGTQSRRHVLNVPAGGMSAFEHDPDSFVRFVRRRGVAADRGTFVRRHLYGAYLESILDEAAAHSDVTLERLTAEAVTIDPSLDGRQASVCLSDGSRVRADRVVMAVGNYPPQKPRIDDDDHIFSGSARYVADPWRPAALAAVDRRKPALLIGSGLTMIDIALELRARGLDAGIIAVSRHGLLPRPHLAQPPAVHDLDKALPESLAAGEQSVRLWLRAIRRHIREAAAQGRDWRDVLAALRPWTPHLWQALSADERRRFLRHVRPFWEVHRHRVAPSAYEAFMSAQRAGLVTVLAARILAIRDAGDCVRVRLRPRRARRSRELQVGSIVNCTGPAGDTRRLRDPLFDALCARGVLRPDALGLGIDTSPTGALIGADGSASPMLFYVGPFSRARDWEATAVPELRRYSLQLAEHLIATLPEASMLPRIPAPELDLKSPA